MFNEVPHLRSEQSTATLLFIAHSSLASKHRTKSKSAIKLSPLKATILFHPNLLYELIKLHLKSHSLFCPHYFYQQA